MRYGVSHQIPYLPEEGVVGISLLFNQEVSASGAAPPRTRLSFTSENKLFYAAALQRSFGAEDGCVEVPVALGSWWPQENAGQVARRPSPQQQNGDVEKQRWLRAVTDIEPQP